MRTAVKAHAAPFICKPCEALRWAHKHPSPLTESRKQARSRRLSFIGPFNFPTYFLAWRRGAVPNRQNQYRRRCQAIRAPTVKLWTITEGLSSTFGSRNMPLTRLAKSQDGEEKLRAVKGDKSRVVSRSLEGKRAHRSQNYWWLTRQTKSSIDQTQVHRIW